jgi:Chaperone of endosialidase
MTTKVTPSVLADTAVTAGTYGGSTQMFAATVDAQGRVTFAANVTPSIAASQITGTLNASQIANNQTYGINVTGNSGTASAVAWSGITSKPTTVSGFGITDMGSQSVNYATSAGSAGNATTAGGLAVATGKNNQANQIVRTDGSGYLQVGYVNSTAGNEKNNANPTYVWGVNGSDDYMRTYNTSYLSVNYATSSGGVSITYSNRSNSTYQVLWGSGSSVYGTDLMYVNPSNGNFYTYGDITAFVSDMRLKNLTGPITGALGKVNQLTGFTYTLNDLAANFGYDTTKSKVGVSAQEVQSVLPEAVSLAAFDIGEDGKSKSGENYLTVSYDKLVPLLIEAIKELNTKVDDLTTKLNTIVK